MSYVNFPGVANVVVDGTSAVTKVLAGVGAGTVAGGIGLGIWAAADTDGFRDAFTRESNSPAAPDPHDPPATLVATPVTSTIDSLAPVAPDPELTPLPLTNVDAPAANPGALAPAETPATAIPQPPLSVSPSAFSPTPQPFAVPDSAASPAIADTPVTLLVALSEHGGISFADVAGDLPAIREILAQWISNAAPDYPLALQGLDIADFGDGSGLSLMVYLNAYVDPSTAFNSALTSESAATLQSAVQHQVDDWLHGAVPEIALVATSTTPIMH